ncbi:expressed unknown protein [Seminavis robusta]|uniref:GST C-terminal domain-containing protein n=1 Tax=Seminavis robusta TaxID=568900 RepID=A0A9N8DKG6_9STRA|nr:expressed unknown protein [Seminavis robusta]|eukprot:Sro178_g077950.1 n/a (290) ;mRNA; r:1387-2363
MASAEATTTDATGSGKDDNKTTITIYALPGSQFTGKVIAAVDARSIEHFCVFVPIPLEARKKFIPSGGTLVPELKAVTADGEVHMIPDSEAILHWFDDNMGTNYFPADSEASELSVRASDKVLAGAVWYFNWADPEGYKNSMKRSMARAMMPAFLPSVLSEMIVDLFLSSIKAKYRQLSMEAMSADEAAMNDRNQIRAKLIDELSFFQSYLKTEEQTYLLGDTSTAADFSVYAQVERLVGDMGDVNLFPSIPEFKTETPELARFWKWHDMMREKHPLKFKGKRPPAASK